MKALLAAILFGLTAHAQSAIITLDFEDQTPNQYRFDNFTVNSMRISPFLSAIVNKDRLDRPGSYLSVDANNNSLRPNQNYLGDKGIFNDLWIDQFGNDFSLLGIESVAPFYNSMLFEITSSKGGYFKSGAPTGTFNLAGDLWQNVSWITLRDIGGDGFHRNHGWDNLMFDVHTVPEPSTLTLLLIGAPLMFLAIARRRKAL